MHFFYSNSDQTLLLLQIRQMFCGCCSCLPSLKVCRRSRVSAPLAGPALLTMPTASLRMPRSLPPPNNYSQVSSFNIQPNCFNNRYSHKPYLKTFCCVHKHTIAYLKATYGMLVCVWNMKEFKRTFDLCKRQVHN